MKALRCLTVLLSIAIIMMLQACGGGSSDTAGSLTISTPTSLDNKDGTFSVTATVTYTPPAGKSAQGVEVTTNATDDFGNSQSDTHTYSSGSNAVIYTYRVFQSVGTSTSLSIVSNIGGMRSGVSVVIPAITPLSAVGIQFTSLEGAGITKTSAITGGIAPYTLVSVSSSDLNATVAGSTLSVTNLTTGATPASATIIVLDAFGSQLSVNVGYFRP
ncbi:MAG: hypothetical protein H7Y42_02905 [Chitinophagaceae bacterium]|nr:hypothetical protein [Chitinophagaceae bacterium]